VSKFINGGLGLPVTVHAADDMRHCDSLYFGKRSRAPDALLLCTEMRVADNAYDGFMYQTRWWPRGGQIMGGWGDGSTGDIFQNKSPRWKAPRLETGANGRLGFVGYTRDQYGSPLGGCTVRCYRTSTEEQVAKVTSDANGLYFATTPYNDAHFLVIHNGDGTLAGATKNSLTPA
jgi:hypothetical protein